MTQASIANPAQPGGEAPKGSSQSDLAQVFPDIPQVRELTRAGLNLCPPPDAEGVRNVVALYRDELGSGITEAEAADILARVMRFLCALNLPSSQQNTDTKPDQNEAVSTTAK